MARFSSLLPSGARCIYHPLGGILLLAVLAAPMAAENVANTGARADTRSMPVIPHIDFERYAGRWYEIARLPNRFQRDCAGDVTATYTLRPDGKIQVLNQCKTAEGKLKSARGTARPATTDRTLGKLKVSFFWPFSGDYWVLALDPEYRWAMVGEPRRRYLWILAREPQLPDEVYRSLVHRAAELGFDTNRLILTRQETALASPPQD